MLKSTYSFKETQGQRDAPLIFTFHGTGGTADQFHGFASDLVPGAHVISPNGDVSEMGAQRFFRRTGEGVYDMDDLARRTQRMKEFVAEQVARTGAKRVIGLGYSNGANILASVLLEPVRLFDAAILMHPLVPWAPAPNPVLKDTRILVTAGQRDPICPAPQTLAFEGYLQDQGADVSTHWHPGGHEIARSELGAIQTFLG